MTTALTPAFPVPQEGDTSTIYVELAEFSATITRSRGVTVTRLHYAWPRR